jgi:glycosyltransferase involved in cell wall biosynthesis
MKIKTKKLTVTIGIPAFNEEVNISNILTDIFKQSEINFRLISIIIVSDGSTDNTVKSVRDFNDKRISLIIGDKRLGKPVRLNQIAKKTSTDILILLDTDIRLKNSNVINYLVEPFLNNKKTVSLTSGYAVPFDPKNIVENIAYAGIKVWEEARKIAKNSDMYYCEGQIRAFSKSLYKKIIFPDYSADDVYAYLYCIHSGQKFASVNKALVQYKLPSTVTDYFNQQRRYLQSRKIQQSNFDAEFIEKYYVIRIKEKLTALFFRILSDPFWTLAYTVLVSIPQILALLTKRGRETRWNILLTTKKLEKNAQ